MLLRILCSPFFTWKKPFAIFIQGKSREDLFYLKDDSFSFFFLHPVLPHLTVTGCQLVRRWAFETMPDEFSFWRVLGSDFIKVLRVACVAIRVMQGNESFNLRRYYLAESSASFSAGKLCSFLRDRNHGDLSRHSRSYYYLRANILRHFSPLRETLPRGVHN